MEYSLAQAAKVAGVGKTTIHTAIKRGRLSARREDDGSYRIDAAELARIYPRVPTERSEASQSNDQERVGTIIGEAGTGEAELRVEVRMLRELLERERETVDD